MIHDLRVAVRSLRRTPGFTLTAILTLALGIGLSTAVFTVADALLLRRLPVLDQDRLIALWGEKRDGSFAHFPLSLADARRFARTTRSLDRVAFVTYEGAWPVSVGAAGDLSRLRRALVSGAFFEVLGVRPVLGRTLRVDDDVIGATPVAVLSNSTWQEKFGGDSAVIGRQIALHESGVTYAIVGIAPEGLEYPRGTEFWAAVVPARTRPRTDSTVADVDVIGRLATGATPSTASAEMTAYFERPEASVWQRDLRGVVHTLPRLVLGDTRPAIIAFAVASALLLLITCINVANLLVVRGIARVQEIAVRSALGAGRWRVVGQLLIENALLAIGGGGFGLGIAAGAVRSFVAFAPPGTPRLAEVEINASVLAAAVAITALAMLVFALAPAIMTSRVELQRLLRSGMGQSASRRSRMASEALVAGQIALALVVLSAAGLIARSLIALERADLSFEPANVLIGELSLRSDRFDDATKQRALLEVVVPRLKTIPGVRAVSPVVAIPFAGTGGWDGKPSAEGQSPAEATANPMLNMEVIGPEYFETFGIRVVRGRSFTEADRESAPSVVMLSESAARHYWPNADPVGKRLRMGPRPLTVVGLVPDTRYRDLREARATIYFPLSQSFFPFAPMMLAVRTTGPPAALIPAIRRAISETDAGVALASAAPFESYLEGPLAQPRLNALLLVVFAVAAVALAAIGLFGVMATMVRQRTRELGVRMALGATAGDLRDLVMRRGLGIAVTGSALGLLAALLANRLLVAMLYDVRPTDAPTLAVTAGFLLLVATLASLIPARSSMRIDPAAALRMDG